MYYQFDSRMNLPALLFDDDRIVVSGKEYLYEDMEDIRITRTPLLATYGIMELTIDGKSVPVPFAKGDLHRLRTAVQEVQHILHVLQARRSERAAETAGSVRGRKGPETGALGAGGPETGKTRAAGTAREEAAQAETTREETAQEMRNAAETAAGDPAQEKREGAGTGEGRDRPVMDPYEEMKKLKELLDLDIITREEFDKKKKELLDL